MARTLLIFSALVWLLASAVRVEAQELSREPESISAIGVDSIVIREVADSAAEPGSPTGIDSTTTDEMADSAGEKTARAAEVRSRARRATVLSIFSTFATQAAGFVLIDSEHEEVAAGLILGGLVLGPATGYIHGGHSLRGLGGVALRSGLIVATTLVVADTNRDEEFAALGGFMLGLLIAEIDAIYEVLSVSSYIRSKDARSRVRLVLRPPGDGRSAQLGIRFSYGSKSDWTKTAKK